MNVITRKHLEEIARAHPTAASWLQRWHIQASAARWTRLNDVRQIYRSADLVGSCLIFDNGNDYRLIVSIVWANSQRHGAIYIKHFITHTEYSREKWKKDCGC